MNFYWNQKPSIATDLHGRFETVRELRVNQQKVTPDINTVNVTSEKMPLGLNMLVNEKII